MTHVDRLQQAARRQDDTRREVCAAVLAARQAGESWTTIAEPFGITKQAARKKWTAMVALAEGGVVGVTDEETRERAVRHVPIEANRYDLR